MNKPLLIISLIFIFSQSLHAKDKEYLELVESEVIQMTASKEELVNKGKVCALSILQFGEVHYNDQVDTLILKGSKKNDEYKTGSGNILIDVNHDDGIVIANSRKDYKGNLNIGHNVQSKIFILIKQGKFKIQHKNISYLQKNTGYAKNDGYSKVGKWKFSGWKKAEIALQLVSKDLIKCMSETTNDDW